MGTTISNLKQHKACFFVHFKRKNRHTIVIDGHDMGCDGVGHSRFIQLL